MFSNLIILIKVYFFVTHAIFSDLLKPLSSDVARKSDSEFLWRWARACYGFGKEQKEKSEEKRMMHEGLACATESLKLKEECSDAHIWCVPIAACLSLLHS